MNFEAITIKDIATALGLSVSTVSKALSDSYEISEKTKKIVIEYAEEHNYRPNPIAKSLKQGNSKSIGIVVSTIDNQFFSQVINGIESIAYSKGYNVIITQTHESFELEALNVKHLTYRSVDGILISLSTETSDVEHLKSLHKKGLPIVFFDRISEEINTHKVIADNFNGAFEGTQHLLDSGYKRIAHITSSPDISITRERLKGYTKALEDRGIAFNEDYVKYCMHGGRDLDEIKSALNDLLTIENRPDAIFTASDRITTTTLLLLQQMKVKIPDEIALLGFTNTQLADALNPSLSTIYQPGFEIGKNAIEMLISIIESKRPVTEFETRVLPTQLYIRNSSSPAKRD
ncbi:LacI family transcriptional regulator [Mucilaginibacter frigoritolerans]|uniref:LacI family transcriptional regulator n=1 Tax=Mucilaginibacter frigoritolerans TaxID=652788 RepID=A0A562TPU4_9SPHI|nr:LacI family DNA-binding transcriptional regulator [Mucilaginibacter frigoritolerans]TWI95565.1 LacI family transcriptional regulator [Mucilaginibacter frigoritolerans]